MDNNLELRKLIREALFKNIDFGNGAPNDIAPNPEDSSSTTHTPEKELSKSISQDERVRKNAFVVVSKKINDSAISEFKRTRKGNASDFSKLFQAVNKKYDAVRVIALKELKVHNRISDKIIKSFEVVSKEMKDILKTKAPQSLSDKNVIDWYQIK